MDAEQRGWFIQLLAEAWESEPQATLPNDDPLLRVLAGVNSSSTDAEQRWGFVRTQFKKRGTVIYNERQMEEVVRQEVNRQKKSEAGKASAEARRVEREVIKAQHLKGDTKPSRRSTPVEIVLPVCTNTTPTEFNLPITSSFPVTSTDKKESKPRDARLDHPALKAVLEVKGKYPTKDVWDLVIKAVGDTPNVVKMRECWLRWRSKNFAPENLGWLLDWYANGATSGNGSKAMSLADIQRMKGDR
jgi:uncharacterized protein YdaU (DUF1376 family)